MNKLFIVLILILTSCAGTRMQNFKNKIDQILTNHIADKANVGLVIQDLTDGKYLYLKNHKQNMIPASTVKLLTSYAALSYLKSDFTYETIIAKDKLNNLYIKFSGDPTLTIDDLKSMIENLNISQIKGNIIIDDTIFDQNHYGKGWSIDDIVFYYVPPISAISINKNAFELTNPLFAKIKSLKIKNEDCDDEEVIANQDNQYEIKLCNQEQADTLRLAYQNPRKLAKDIVFSALKDKKIKYDKEIIFAELPEKHVVLIEHSSKKLKDIVYEMMINSDNAIADNMLKTLGSRYYNTQGSFENGIAAIKEILPLETSRIKLVDGSGGSRYNLIPPLFFTDFLFKINKDLKIWPEMYEAMDGIYLDKDKNEIDAIYAKTGSMSGVANLAGYMKTKDDKLYAFSIMINNFIGPLQELKDIRDKIIKEIKQQIQ